MPPDTHVDVPKACMYLLVSGRVKLGMFSADDEDGKIRVLKEGDAFGDFSIVDDKCFYEKLHVKTMPEGVQVSLT